MSKLPPKMREKTIFDNVVFKFLFKFLFKCLFRLTGWKTLEYKTKGSGIMVAAPHTSNWDFIWAFGGIFENDVKIYFSIKSSWCEIPVLGKLMLWLGAMPIDRSKKNGQVESIKEFIKNKKNEEVLFLFTPEGTRSLVDKWKTGFYNVSKETGLPIYLSGCDYIKKEAGFYCSFNPTDNQEMDFRYMQCVYHGVAGKFIDKQYPRFIKNFDVVSEKEYDLIVFSDKIGLFSDIEEINKKYNKNFSKKDVLELINKGIVKILTDKDNLHSLTDWGVGYILYYRNKLLREKNE